MDTSEILKSLEDPEPVPEQPKIQLDLSQLQGALILIQDNLATQQKMIAELVNTTNSIKDSTYISNRDINNKIDGLPNKLNNTYSQAVSTLSRTMQDKLDNDNRISSAIINANDDLLVAQTDIESATNELLQAADKIGDTLAAIKMLAHKLSVERYLHYGFLILFTFWLAYARFTSWGDAFMVLSTASIVIGAIFSQFY